MYARVGGATYFFVDHQRRPLRQRVDRFWATHPDVTFIHAQSSSCMHDTPRIPMGFTADMGRELAVAGQLVLI